MDVKDYYDEYVARQLSVGVNQRHRAILGWLRRFGLQPDHRVLEIGCGIGTLTGLIASAVREGSVTALDLSPKSIEAASERLARFDTVELIAGDVLTLEVRDRFDVVVLPDVIEHIPLESHPALFARVAAWVKPDGFVLLHYPNPNYLAWCHVNKPAELQVVDQPVPADGLLANVYRHGLHLDHYERYSIWIREGDYVVAVLRPSAGVGNFTELPEPDPTFRSRLIDRARRLSRR